MRLAESKIKDALLHPDVYARQLALDYFAGAHRRDGDLVPFVRQAVERYGRVDCFAYQHALGHLTPGEADVAWIVQELHRGEPADAEEKSYDTALVQMLCNADPRWVRPLETGLLRAPRLDNFSRKALAQYLEATSWDVDRCWLELERMSGMPLGKSDDDKVDLGFAGRIVASLVRTGKADPQRVLELLTQTIEEFDGNPMYWMEIFAVMLAGEMRLEAGVPLLVQKLHVDGDFLREQTCVALAKINTPAVADALAANFPNQPWDYRLYAAGAFDAIHNDAVVKHCLELLPGEQDSTILTSLAAGLVLNFAYEGIEPVRSLVANDEIDPTMRDIGHELCTAATIMEVTFPELAGWKQRAEEKQNRFRANMRAMERGLPVPFPPTRPHLPAPVPTPARGPSAAFRVGRNDPCPCGSGKKYKKCCLNRQAGLGFPR